MRERGAGLEGVGPAPCPFDPLHPKPARNDKTGRALREGMPRRKYGHLVMNIGKKADGRGPVAGCPKCARGACAMHL